jgi:hypothetical protein
MDEIEEMMLINDDIHEVCNMIETGIDHAYDSLGIPMRKMVSKEGTRWIPIKT